MAMAGNRRQPQQDIAGFPLLSFLELKDCLLALGISVTAEDISKPSPQTTMMINNRRNSALKPCSNKFVVSQISVTN
ncbi:MAG: hypothetical protein EOP04_10945 [Proteobacteria bacterium]|nr:MAG: hypothetical protein EOP04_10945 [Pseudomonadota bacterium]